MRHTTISSARLIALVLAALLAVAVLMVLALLLFVDPNRYRGEIEQAVAQHTGRQLIIHGTLRLRIFPWLALSVRDVQLGNPPGFASAEPGGAFLIAQTASVGVKLLPLLAKRLELSRVALEGVTLNLESRGEANNWQDLTGSTGSATGGTPSAGASVGSASVEGVDLTGTVVLRDELQKTVTRVPFSLHTSRIDFDARTQRLAPAKIEANVDAMRLLMSLSGERMSSDRLVTGELTVPETSPRKLLQSLGIDPPVTRDTGALSALALQTNFRLTPKQLQLTDLRLTLDQSQIRGTAAVDDLGTSALGFDLSVSAIDVDRYRAPVQKPPAGTRTQLAEPAPTPLPLQTLRKLDAHGTLRVGTATFAAVTFNDVVMPIAARAGNVHLGPTQARLYGGTYNGDIALDARPVQAQLSLSEHVRGTDIGALARAAFDSALISGRGDANVAITGVGNTDRAMIHSLSGKIDANVKQGALNGIDITHELQRANAVLKRQPLPRRTGPERTPFNTLQASATLDKGVLRTDAMEIATDFLKVRGRGTLDLATEAIDYQLGASVLKIPSSGGAGGLDSLMAVEVPLRVTGTLSSPTVRPDIEALARGPVRQEVQQRAIEQVKKKLGDQLKGLFGH